jgi:uncharacterized protein YacL
MENFILIAIISTILFLIIKFLEMKYLEKELKPMKEIVRDGIIVFISTIISAYGMHFSKNSITDFFNVITENKVMNTEATQIFTDTPAF